MEDTAPVAPEKIPATEPVTPDPAVESAVYSGPHEVTAKIEVPAEQTVIVQESGQPGVPPTTLYPSHTVVVTTASKMAAK
jgi:hypothetical protein